MKFCTPLFPRLVFSVAVLLGSIVRADTTVVILRHGEKPSAGLGQLTCRGLNRSLALAPVLLGRYGMPTAIYAVNPSSEKFDNGVAYAYVRPLATIEPLAIHASLPVNIQWGMTEIEPLAAQLLSKSDGTYVVAWEHHWGEALAKKMLSSAGGKSGDVPNWNDADFDSLFVIRMTHDDQGKSIANFSHEQQDLNGLPIQCSDATGSVPEHS